MQDSIGCRAMDSAAEAREVIESHVAVIGSSEKIEQDQTVRTLARRDIRIQNIKDFERCGDNIVVPVSKIEASVAFFEMKPTKPAMSVARPAVVPSHK